MNSRLGAAVVTLGLITWPGAAAITLAPPAVAADQPGTARDRSWIEQRVDAWQPSKEERAFDTIGWARDLREAERLAKEQHRPIFLFTYDGASLAHYRC
jgi:hypothetical protein